MHTVAVKRTDPTTLESVYNTLYDLWKRHKGFQGRLLIQRFPNDAVAAVGDEETAYPWRDAIASLQVFPLDPTPTFVQRPLLQIIADRLLTLPLVISKAS